MVVCRFFLQGNCKFGDNCRNEHPSRSSSGSSRNPFAPLQNSSNHRPGQGSSQTSSTRDGPPLPFNLNKTTLANDLSIERPQWILSAYAPGRDTPSQLFGGFPREQSFEELRVRHYQLAVQGKSQEAMQEAQLLVNNAEDQMRTALNDVDGAIKYLLEGENQHPNRIDICKAKGALGQGQPQSINTPNTTSFGQPSGVNPAFGQPLAPPITRQPAAPAFGQPSAPLSNFGGSAGPTFGQPSMGQPSIFGRPSTSFGPTNSTIGQPAGSAPTFGQPSVSISAGFPQQPASANAQQPNPFQKASAPVPTSMFGQPQPPQPNNPFAQTTTQNSTAAGNPFAPKTSNMNVFSQTPGVSQSPFNNVPTAQQSSMSDQRPSGSVPASTHITSTAQIQKDSLGKLRSWNGKAVTYIDGEPCYRGDDSNWQRVWFPDGAPSFANALDPPDEAYDNLTKENYQVLRIQGKFMDGLMPLLPPKKDWCDWNL